MSEEQTIVKSIRMPVEMERVIQSVADNEHRSFSKQVLFFLEQELTHTETHNRDDS